MDNINKQIIVLGMHRSGTSIVAGILHTIGVKMGQNVEHKNRFSPKGYFEDKILLDLNKDILRYNSSSWKKPPRYKLKLNDNHKKTLTILFNKTTKLRGWKDPQTVLTFPSISTYIKNPHFIICHRNPLEISRSLKERDGISIEAGLILTNIYNAKIIKILADNKNAPHTHLSFNDLITKPKKQAQNIAKLIGLKIDESHYKKLIKLIVPPDQIYFERKRLERSELLDTRGWKIFNFIYNVKNKIPIIRNI